MSYFSREKLVPAGRGVEQNIRAASTLKFGVILDCGVDHGLTVDEVHGVVVVVSGLEEERAGARLLPPHRPAHAAECISSTVILPQRSRCSRNQSR